jgi:hypothetical protein
VVGEVGKAKMAALDTVGEDEILERIAQGETMQMLCKQYDIGTKLWYKWLDSVEGRRGRYNAAMNEAGHFYASRAVNTAQSATPETINVARLQVDTDKWMAAKRNAGYDTRQRDVAINISVNDLHAQAAALLGDVIEGDAVEVSDDGD